jgi:tetratricopeptide (TPR) repeat protein
MKRFAASICALVSLALPSAGADASDKLAAYLKLAREERWAEAFPLIEEVVALQPKLETSWFNRGVCLDGLSRHKEAAQSFRRAYALKPSDYGAQYRVFRSLALAEDYEGFAGFLEEEGQKMPEIFELLREEPLFAKAFAAKPVKDVVAKRKTG